MISWIIDATLTTYTWHRLRMPWLCIRVFTVSIGCIIPSPKAPAIAPHKNSLHTAPTQTTHTAQNFQLPQSKSIIQHVQRKLHNPRYILARSLEAARQNGITPSHFSGQVIRCPNSKLVNNQIIDITMDHNNQFPRWAYAYVYLFLSPVNVICLFFTDVKFA